MERISVDSKRFIDEYGRERIFYGINMGSKNAPFFKSFNPKKKNNSPEYYIKELKYSGMNVIRYFFNWSCLEPNPGLYSEDVLNEIQNFLDLCEKYNIYVILDMHQDLYSSFHNSNRKLNIRHFGDGAPKWACITDNKKVLPSVITWAEGYFFSKGVHNAFRNFWDNTSIYGKGLQEHFCDLWKVLAKRFGSHPALLGFDLFNEPFPSTDGQNVFLMIAKSAVKATLKGPDINRKKLLSSCFKKHPVANILSQYNSKVIRKITEPCYSIIEKFDKEKYTPFLNRVTKAIREETENGIILIENSYWSNIGIPFSSPPITVGGKRENKQAFAPHAYDLLVDTPLYNHADNERVGAIFERRKYEQDHHLNMPLIVGEWGGGGRLKHWMSHAEYLLNLFDRYKWSSIYWSFFPEIFDMPIMDMLRRTHPIAVCGEIEHYSFDRNINTFELCFRQEREYTASTEIFCHQAPKSVETDGKYSIENLNGKSCILKLFTSPGTNRIRITF